MDHRRTTEATRRRRRRPLARAEAEAESGRSKNAPQPPRTRAPVAAHQDRVRHQGSSGPAARVAILVSDVIAELRKVQWPTRPQLIQSTAVVILVVAIVTIYLDIVDTIVSRIVHAIF